MRRIPLNCWLVAMWIWGMSRARSWIAVKRSVSLRGMIPHFAVMRERGGTIIMIEYIPRRRKRWLSDSSGQCFALFDGIYRAREFRLVSVGTGDTMAEAMKSRIAHKGPAGPSSFGRP